MTTNQRALTIELRIDGASALALAVDDAGSISRQGSAFEQGNDPDRYVGQGDPGTLARILEGFPDDVDEHAGSYEFPNRAGKDCLLKVVLARKGQDPLEFEFRYGSKSERPPRDVVDLVRRAVAETEDWFQAQIEAMDG